MSALKNSPKAINLALIHKKRKQTKKVWREQNEESSFSYSKSFNRKRTLIIYCYAGSLAGTWGFAMDTWSSAEACAWRPKERGAFCWSPSAGTAGRHAVYTVQGEMGAHRDAWLGSSCSQLTSCIISSTTLIITMPAFELLPLFWCFSGKEINHIAVNFAHNGEHTWNHSNGTWHFSVRLFAFHVCLGILLVLFHAHQIHEIMKPKLKMLFGYSGFFFFPLQTWTLENFKILEWKCACPSEDATRQVSFSWNILVEELVFFFLIRKGLVGILYLWGRLMKLDNWVLGSAGQVLPGLMKIKNHFAPVA